jgi:hypothetical protein
MKKKRPTLPTTAPAPHVPDPSLKPKHGPVVTIPADMQFSNEGRKSLHGPVITGLVYGRIMRKTFTDVCGHDVLAAHAVNTSIDEVEAVVKAVARDPVEEMLVMQMMLAHARILRFNDLMWQQSNLEPLSAVSEALEKAHNTFRRMLLALAEYRNPRTPPTFTAIKTAIGQQNVASQQLVANAPSPEFPEQLKQNEQGLPDGTPGAQAHLPVNSEGIGIPTGRGSEGPAVVEEHRPQDPLRQATE